MSISALEILPLKDKLGFRRQVKSPVGLDAHSIDRHNLILAEAAFIRMLCVERKRTERSKKLLLLMLLDVEGLWEGYEGDKVLDKLTAVLASSTRETDINGWYKADSVMGVIFTEIGVSDKSSIKNAILTKVNAALRANLNLEEINKVHVSLHFFPEGYDKQDLSRSVDAKLYPDLEPEGEFEDLSLFLKRAMDITGSILALILFFPALIVISLLVKLSSKGPILYRQQRIGQGGKTFTFLKFRSMYVNSSADIHKEYVNHLITGKSYIRTSTSGESGIYKIKHDPRITWIGKFLRKSSLDELPQLWNVIKGEMSLVGPRPPIPYEFESYDIWHRRRVLEAKPGVTGLWQVKGRSKTTFDEMVRLDLRYARAWSLWLDVKILLQTPLAVLSGSGAY